jgi:hypothetical protein
MKTTKEMTIFFEIDGPIQGYDDSLPLKKKQKTTELDIQQHSTQLLKKKILCFLTSKNEISEFKGFEMKRRGELRVYKGFSKRKSSHSI